MKTFSVNALTELLERDRATIVRALRKVPPDATERKQPRWKMTTAIAAVDALPAPIIHRRAVAVMITAAAARTPASLL